MKNSKNNFQLRIINLLGGQNERVLKDLGPQCNLAEARCRKFVRNLLVNDRWGQWKQIKANVSNAVEWY